MNDELDIAAAEYVLGALPADERADFAMRLERDPELREAVRRWQARFAPLDAAVPPEAPPSALWQRIEAATGGDAPAVYPDPAPVRAETGAASNVVQFRRRLNFWRGATAAMGALAAGLAAVVVIDRFAAPPEPAGGRYVAVVDSGGHEPALIAEVDTTTGVIRVQSLAAETPAGSSLELWHVPEGQAPRSLGVLEAGAEAQTIRDAVAAGPVGGVLAVSVEPEGGSPTGAPTGPVIYTGRLIPVE
jgi:anti-sigma-K factor RskA